jgi:DNA polymerase III epsilon subunit family exonuclease
MSEDNQSNHFIAIDVETANADISSICQIGIVEFQDGKIINQWETLVNPSARFDAKNISIHGIHFDMVKDAPKFPEVHGKIQEWVKDKIVVTHTPFDQNSLNNASQKYGLPEILCTWIDSARVVRQQWEQFSQSGYGLPNITEYLGITYKAHSAMEDARVAGEVVLKAMEQSGNPLKKYIKRIHKSKVIVKEIEQIVKFQSSYIEPYPLKVSDVSFYQKSIENIVMFTGDDEGVNQDDFIAHLILENTNYDPNAVRVEIDKKRLDIYLKEPQKHTVKNLLN